MTDKELEKIYNEAYKAVYWTAMSLLKNEADAEDVVQDTFVTLIESYDTIEDKNKVTAWLKKIAANKCLNRLTRTKTDAVEDEFFEDVEAVPEDFLPDTIVESAEMRKIIMDIIEKSLSNDIRRTLILFYFDEMSTKEIADTLGVPEGTVRRRLNFARNKIKKEVEKYEEDNKTKLFGMAALPFLSKLFIKEAEQVPFKAMPASLTTTLSASARASTQGAETKIAASAAKKGTGLIMKKVIIGSIVAVVAVGTVVGVIMYFANRQPNIKPENTTVAVVVNESETSMTENEADIIETTTEETSEITAPVIELSASEYYVDYPLHIDGKSIYVKKPTDELQFSDSISTIYNDNNAIDLNYYYDSTSPFGTTETSYINVRIFVNEGSYAATMNSLNDLDDFEGEIDVTLKESYDNGIVVYRIDQHYDTNDVLQYDFEWAIDDKTSITILLFDTGIDPFGESGDKLAVLEGFYRETEDMFLIVDEGSTISITP